MTRRYRATIFVNIFIDDEEDAETSALKALDIAQQHAHEIPNAYLGGVATLREVKEGMVFDERN